MKVKSLQEKNKSPGVFEKIYSVVSTIPKGKVMTYGQIAKRVNISPQVVGFALSANKDPKHVPCHRVVGSSGKLTGYAFGGIKKKKEILEKEGVYFINAETVDLENSAIQ